MFATIAARNEIRFFRRLIPRQIQKLVQLIGYACVVGILYLLFPTFFDYRYLYFGGFGRVFNFWPAYLWAALGTFLAHAFTRFPLHPNVNNELFKSSFITSVLAGVWEEIGFRFIYVCFAMLGIWLLNFLFSSGIGWPTAIGALVGCVICFQARSWRWFTVWLVVGVVALVFALQGNPVYWFYEFLILVVRWTTLGFMDPVIFGGLATPVMLYGFISANSMFRDGHKYQGLLGYINSWYMGMVFIYCTVMYGLLTAIVVHALYDIVISVMRYVIEFAKYNRR